MKTSESYSKLQVALRWGVVVLIAVNYVVSDNMGRALQAVLKGGAVTGLTPKIHVYVGLAILALVAVRLVVRLIQGAPAADAAGPDLLKKAVAAAHGLLYLLLVAVPVLGALTWFGRIGVLGDVHVVAMNVMLAIAGLHAAAALYHHYILKDGVLLRMIRPGQARG
ncbi:cytochrome b [Actibacterium sp. D379-3]